MGTERNPLVKLLLTHLRAYILPFCVAASAVSAAAWAPPGVPRPGTPSDPSGSSALLESTTNRVPSSPALSGKRAPLSPSLAQKSATIRDEELQRRARARLQDDPATRPFARQVAVQRGVITLNGRTCHPKAREAAEAVVARMPGVRAVHNLITVEPNADLTIADKLHAAFSKDPGIDDAAIGVTVIDRKVFLSGTAHSADVVTQVGQIAASIPGVVAVSNGLQAPPAAASKWPRTPVAARSNVYLGGRSSYR